MFKLSVVIPVYYNRENLMPLYQDLKERLFSVIDYGYELIFVDDGSGDGSWNVLKQLAALDCHIRLLRLSRNFGSQAAILCGLLAATGDCAVTKAADMQEPTEIILDMVEKWRSGDNVVLAVRAGRDENRATKFFSGLYYTMVRKTAFPQMPKGGFDNVLVDRKVIEVLSGMDEKNSALSGQILWSGFKTGRVDYVRRAREIGKSRWTFRKKIRLVTDTLFGFTNLPVTAVTAIGALSFLGAVLWSLWVLIAKLNGSIDVTGWSTLFIFNLFSFGTVMISIGILGSYVWRTFDAARNRPPFVIEESFGNGAEPPDLRRGTK